MLEIFHSIQAVRIRPRTPVNHINKGDTVRLIPSPGNGIIVMLGIAPVPKLVPLLTTIVTDTLETDVTVELADSTSELGTINVILVASVVLGAVSAAGVVIGVGVGLKFPVIVVICVVVVTGV